MIRLSKKWWVLKPWMAVSAFLFYLLFPWFVELFEGYALPTQDQLSVYQEGEQYLTEGNFKKAISSYEKVLSLAIETNDELSQVKCYSRLGLLFWNTGQLNKSSEFYENASALARKLNEKAVVDECESAIKIYNLYSEGKSYRRQQEYAKSIKSFEEAIKVARKINSSAHELKCLRLLSITFWEMSDLENFFQLNEQGLKIAERLNHKREVGKAWNNMGLYYWKHNEFSKSLSFFHNALSTAKELKDIEEESVCLNNIGIIYKIIGHYNKAFFYLKGALEIDEHLSDKVNLAKDLINIGTIFQKRAILNLNEENELLTKSLEYYTQSLELLRDDIGIITEVRALNNIGNVHLDMKNYHDALIFLQEGLVKVKKIYDYESEGMLLNNIGSVYLTLGNIEFAEKYFMQAINLAEKVGASNILWEAFFGFAKGYEKKNEYSQAIIFYKKAIGVIEKVRSLIALDISKAGFAQNKLQVYEGLINLLYKISMKDSSSSDNQEVFYTVERAKARAFLDMLAESRIDISSKLSSSLRSEEQALTDRISGYLRELYRADLSIEERKNIENKLLQTEDEYMALISRMRLDTPEIAGMILPEPVRLERIQERLDDHTALIEYNIGKKQSYVFCITKESFKIFILPTQEEIHKSLHAFLKLLSEPPDGRFRGEAAARRLYQELLSPLEKDIPGDVTNLVIVPDGVLYYLPFEVLIPPASDRFTGQEYLMSKYSISYSPSASSLLFLLENKKREEKSKDILALGNPTYSKGSSYDQSKGVTPASILMELYESLGFDFSPIPQSEREVKKIASFFPKERCDVYLKDRASEQTLKEIPLNQYRIVHFACHSFLDEKFPSRSALVLSFAHEETEDGFLQVREIYNLRFNADLVVLSACQTGRGKLERGEGILGLPRIFFYTGARSVVSTLWKIGDKPTAKFMELFYKSLSTGENKAQALRIAKLKMLKTRYFHPFYWGAFVLNGEYGSAIFSQ